MTRQVMFYHAKTGELMPHVFMTSDERTLALNTPAGHKAIDVGDETLSPQTHTIDVGTGQPIARSAPLPDPRAAARATAAAHAEIERLEHGQARAVREFLLGRGGADRLQEIDAAIAAERAKL
jgi:hypothetical protein